MNITIFGCCRQDPLYKLYDITPIRNRLTYTHYGQEILQAISFCKNPTDEKIKNSFMFRSFILNPKKRPKINWTRHFYNTDLFVVELASRKSHFLNGVWLHEAYRDPSYAFSTPDAVVIEEANADKINQMVTRIIEELRPKKVMFVTHVYTHECQHRKVLASEIKHACAKFNVPVFDPVEQFGGQNIIKKYLLKEDIIAHYSSEGNDLLQNYYENFISKHFGYKPPSLKKTSKHAYIHLLNYISLARRVFR